jgi:hypothetical protein
MAKLKLGPIADDKPVKVTLELPAACIAICRLCRHPRSRGRTVRHRSRPLIVPMLERFIATDRGFAKAARNAIVWHAIA